MSHTYDSPRLYDLWEEPPDPDDYDDDIDDEPPETWDSHPSLTVEQRNPTLR